MSPKPPKALRANGAASAVTLREHLIGAADQLLGESAPLALTTRDIARAAGVSDGVLYNHFADKDELIVAAVTRRVLRLSGRIEAAIPSPGTGDVAGNLLAMAKALLGLHEEALPLIAGLLSAPDLLRRVFEALHAGPAMMPAGVIRVVEYLAAEQARGRVAEGIDPSVATRLFFGAVLTTALGEHFAHRHGGATPAPGGLDAAIATLMAGLAPRIAARSSGRSGRAGRE